MLKFAPLDLLKFSEFDHFRSKSPLPFPVKSLLVKPLPVSTSGRILPRTADLVFDSLSCMFDSFLRFNSCLRSSIYFSPVSIDIGAVGFISMRFALFVCSSIHFWRFDSFVHGSIYVCAGSLQFLCRSIHFLGRSIYFCVVRFIFCCFDILWPIFVLFVCVSYCSFCSLKILSVSERHRGGGGGGVGGDDRFWNWPRH